jgi:hypothetical protein
MLKRHTRVLVGSLLVLSVVAVLTGCPKNWDGSQRHRPRVRGTLRGHEPVRLPFRERPATFLAGARPQTP